MAEGVDSFAALRQLIDGAVADRVVPGAVLLGASGGVTRFHEAFGARQLEPERLPATRETIYDIASLTKAVSTSVLTMKAVAGGLLTLGDRVSRHLPEFQGQGKDVVTVRHLLCHASGLPPHRPFHEQVAEMVGPVARRDAIHVAAAREPLVAQAGARSVYSDVGFILLGWILERVLGQPLDELFSRLVSRPLALTSTYFVRVQAGPGAGPGPGPGAGPGPGSDAASPPRGETLPGTNVAPTERCPTRRRLLQGEVDDLNAYAMGGVAGHAGLFSAAADLGRVAAALVAAWAGGGGDAPLVPAAVIREFWRPSGVAGSTWRLGWDGPAINDSQAGDRISREAVGHLGFTGCSLWIDPAHALWVILLTNRIHPVAAPDPRFRRFRGAVHDAIIDAMAGA